MPVSYTHLVVAFSPFFSKYPEIQYSSSGTFLSQAHIFCSAQAIKTKNKAIPIKTNDFLF